MSRGNTAGSVDYMFDLGSEGRLINRAITYTIHGQSFMVALFSNLSDHNSQQTTLTYYGKNKGELNVVRIIPHDADGSPEPIETKLLPSCVANFVAEESRLVGRKKVIPIQDEVLAEFSPLFASEAFNLMVREQAISFMSHVNAVVARTPTSNELGKERVPLTNDNPTSLLTAQVSGIQLDLATISGVTQDGKRYLQVNYQDCMAALFLTIQLGDRNYIVATALGTPTNTHWIFFPKNAHEILTSSERQSLYSICSKIFSDINTESKEKGACKEFPTDPAIREHLYRIFSGDAFEKVLDEYINYYLAISLQPAAPTKSELSLESIKKEMKPLDFSVDFKGVGRINCRAIIYKKYAVALFMDRIFHDARLVTLSCFAENEGSLTHKILSRNFSLSSEHEKEFINECGMNFFFLQRYMMLHHNVLTMNENAHRLLHDLLCSNDFVAALDAEANDFVGGIGANRPALSSSGAAAAASSAVEAPVSKPTPAMLKQETDKLDKLVKKLKTSPTDYNPAIDALNVRINICKSNRDTKPKLNRKEMNEYDASLSVAVQLITNLMLQQEKAEKEAEQKAKKKVAEKNERAKHDAAAIQSCADTLRALNKSSENILASSRAMMDRLNNLMRGKQPLNSTVDMNFLSSSQKTLRDNKIELEKNMGLLAKLNSTHPMLVNSQSVVNQMDDMFVEIARLQKYIFSESEAEIRKREAETRIAVLNEAVATLKNNADQLQMQLKIKYQQRVEAVEIELRQRLFVTCRARLKEVEALVLQIKWHEFNRYPVPVELEMRKKQLRDELSVLRSEIVKRSQELSHLGEQQMVHSKLDRSLHHFFLERSQLSQAVQSSHVISLSK